MNAIHMNIKPSFPRKKKKKLLQVWMSFQDLEFFNDGSQTGSIIFLMIMNVDHVVDLGS